MSCKPHAPVYGQEGDFIDDSLEAGSTLSEAVGGFIGGEGNSPGKAFGHLGTAITLAQGVYREGLDYARCYQMGSYYPGHWSHYGRAWPPRSGG